MNPFANLFSIMGAQVNLDGSVKATDIPPDPDQGEGDPPAPGIDQLAADLIEDAEGDTPTE